MKWSKITKDAYQVSEWSGGTTTELAIKPEKAVYADRDFLWRLSSARVDLPHSNFSALPDYDRLILPLEGSLVMQVGDAEKIELAPLETCAFDGAAETESWGTCRDFNLMLRKGRCRGYLQAVKTEAGSTVVLTPPTVSGRYSYDAKERELALYCVSGACEVLAADGKAEAAAEGGETLLCRNALPQEAIRVRSEAGAVCILAVMEQIA